MKKRFSSSPKPTLGKGTWGLGQRGSRSHQYLIPFAAWARLKPSSSHASPPPDPIVVCWPDHLRPMTSGPSVTEARSPVTDLTLDRVTDARGVPSSSPANNNMQPSNNAAILQFRKPSPSSATTTPLPPSQAHTFGSESEAPNMAYQRFRGLILGLSSHQECIWRKCQTDRQWSMW